jgi:hypothetical protein
MLRPKVLGFLIRRILNDNDMNALKTLFNDNGLSISDPYNEYGETAIMAYQTIGETTEDMTKFLINQSLNGLCNTNSIGLTVLDIALLEKQIDFYEHFCKHCPQNILKKLKDMALKSDKINVDYFTTFNELKDFYFHKDHNKGSLNLTENDLTSIGVSLSDLRKNPTKFNETINMLC